MSHSYSYPPPQSPASRGHSYSAAPPPATPTAAGGPFASGGPTYVVGGNQSFSIPIPSTPSGSGGGGGGIPATPSTPAAGGRRRTAGAAGLEPDLNDYLEFTPLGAGCEVGRSCHILRFKGKTVMLDCGLHPAYVGVSSLPFFDEIEPSEVDLLLVSHFHLDHAAALPYFLQKTDFKGKCFMTHPTKSIYKLILQDYIKVSHLSVEDVLYTEKDLLASMERIDVLNFHEVVHHAGIKFWAYNAGHVLGAAMFVIEIAGVRILYTGDYSRREDRHLMSAELPGNHHIDVLVVEATYGIQRLPPVSEREQRFTELVRDIVERRRGKALLPVFALGRAQELLLILDEFWAQNPALHSIPIYYASALAKKCMSVYQTYINMMNRRIQSAAQVSNPFIFRHIFNLKGGSMDALDDAGPCVVMASPGMLQNGLSRELLEMWAGDAENGCVLTGYCVEGTLAKHILTEPESIPSMNGPKIPLRMSVAYISFSAHADYTETSEFIDLLKPPHIILVHGDASEGVGRLRYALEAKYKDGSIKIVAPRNSQTVQLQFRAQKVAKTMGSLAAQPPSQGQRLSGLLVRKNFVDYSLIAAEELSQFTALESTTVEQSLTVPFHQTFECLRFFVGQMYDLGEEGAEQGEEGKEQGEATRKTEDTEAKKDTAASEDGAASEEKKADERVDDELELVTPGAAAAAAADAAAAVPSLLVHGSVRLSYHTTPSPHVRLNWASNPVSDMLSDSLIALLASMQSNPGMAKVIGSAGGCRNAQVRGHTAHKHGASCGHAHGAEEQAADATDAQASSSLSAPAFSGSAADAAYFASALKPSAVPTGATRGRPSFLWFLQQHYGSDIAFDASARTYSFTLNDVACVVRADTLEVECADPELRARIRAMVRRAHAACMPITAVNSAPINEAEEESKMPAPATATAPTAAST